MPLTSLPSLARRSGPVAGKHAFTLIELLTVIAIIGILAAILIPVVGRVRDSAHSSQCSSNMRQVGLAINLYAADNKNASPNAVAAGALTNGEPTSWYLQMVRYLGGDLSSQDRTRRALRVFVCPASVRSASGEKEVPWNGFNNSAWPFISDFGINYAVNNPNYARGVILKKLDSPRNPSRTPLLAEMVYQNNFIAANFNAPRPLSDEAAYAAGSGTYQRFSQRHGGGGNVLFFDGHVERLSYDAFVQRANTGTTPLDYIEGR